MSIVNLMQIKTAFFITVCSLGISIKSYADTDIWLLKFNADKSLDLSSAKNITQRIGYDNQPSFSRNGQGLYYTKMLQTENGQQADLFYFDFAAQQHRNLTRTVQSSEYSPTESPIAQNQLVTVKVEPDGTQRLWTVNTLTGQQQMLQRTLKPVGYFAWGKQEDLLLFILDEPMKLKYAAHYKDKDALTIDTNIGRSIRYNANNDWYTYSKGNNSQQTLWKYDHNINQKTELVKLPERSQYYTWLNDQQVLSAQGSKLMKWTLGSQNQWQLLGDLTSVCPKGISRVAVNGNQTRIALVCNEETP